MKIFAETPRLILRELVPRDEEGMFALDSDPEVARYLGAPPLTEIAQSRRVIAFIREQYRTNGIGRWAVELKENGAFIGWAGLKLVRETINGHRDYYDLGYRLIRRHWGKGYASEAAAASVAYGFGQLKLDEIFAMVVPENAASRRVLEKAGFQYVEYFEQEEETLAWYRMEKPRQG